MRRTVLITGILLTILLSACSHNMRQQDMFRAPDLQALPEVFTVVRFEPNSQLELAGSVGGRFAWPAVVMDKNGKKDEHYRAIDYRVINPRAPRGMFIVLSGSLAQYEGKKTGIEDRCGELICNQAGACIQNSGIKYNSPFLTEIKAGAPGITEVRKGSDLYWAMVKMQEEAGLKFVSVLKKRLEDKYGIYDMSTMTKDQLEAIAEKDSTVRSIIRELGSGWYGLIAYPIVTPVEEGVYILLAKVVKLPDFRASKNVSGCFSYKPDAGDVADMVLRARGLYPSAPAMITATAPSGAAPLSPELKAKIKAETGKEFQTYEEYNAYVLEYNAKIK